MRVLIIGKVWPEPASSAAGKRTLDIIDSLNDAGWEMHFACVAQKSEYSVDLAASRSIQEHAIALNCDSFDAWIAALAPDIVIFDRFALEEQFGWRTELAVPDAARIVDTSDLHCLRDARHRSLRAGEALDLRNQVALREIASIYRSDLTLIISEAEIAILDREFRIDTELLAYWPFLLPEPERGNPPFEKRRHCMMIGNFLHEPNYDAVRWCREAIWPLIRQRLPDTELRIYGSYADARAKQLSVPDQGFKIEGRAENAIETLRQHRLNLAPLRFGAGLKGKLADAFLAGTPSVATSIAVEGMTGSFDWGSPIVDTPQGYADACVDLYTNRSPWLRAQECGYTIATQRFSAKRWMKALPELLLQAHEQRHNRRGRNFIGQMLRHHQHRSTEYMSRWIAEKNRPKPS